MSQIVALVLAAAAVIVLARRYLTASRRDRGSEAARGERLLMALLLMLLLSLLLWDLGPSVMSAVSGSPPAIKIAQIVGWVAVLISFLLYAAIFIYFRGLFVGMPLTDVVASLLSHVPSDDSPASPHICAGMAGSLGICLLIGAHIALLSTTDPVTQESLALTAGALAFAVLISGVSFWTLCQTKRIEQAQGAQLTGFRDLIKALTDDMKRVNEDFHQSGARARVHHRLIMVTTNPHFGNLSFPYDDLTAEFEKELKRAAQNVERSQSHPANERFQMDILCGTTNAITEFHQAFYRPDESTLAPVTDERVVKKTAAVEALINDLNRAASISVVSRIDRVPRTQFAIVGNTVYEFILESPGLESEVHEARKITERVACNRFRETFDILKGHQ